LEIFFQFWYHAPKKSGNPGRQRVNIEDDNIFFSISPNTRHRQFGNAVSTLPVCAGLPDGLFPFQKYQYGYILQFNMLVYFMAFWHML
jgi:hypothetical protein